MSESLTTDQRVTLLESRVNHLEDALAQFLAGNSGAQPERLIASSPVMPDVFGAWGGDWFDASPFAKLYGAKGEYHTGADLNRPGFADSGANVYAAADGLIVYSGMVPVAGWQGEMIVLRHADIQQPIWTRYAHLVSLVKTQTGAFIKRGTLIGKIADYNKDGPKGDHLHFDVSYLDLGDKPSDWPGTDRARLLRTYLDPLQWLKDHKQ